MDARHRNRRDGRIMMLIVLACALAIVAVLAAAGLFVRSGR